MQRIRATDVIATRRSPFLVGSGKINFGQGLAMFLNHGGVQPGKVTSVLGALMGVGQRMVRSDAMAAGSCSNKATTEKANKATF